MRCYSTLMNQEWKVAFQEYSKNAIDWYKLDVSTLDEKTSKILKKHFQGSLYKALCAIFPETEWKPWKFIHQTVPYGYWIDETNQRKFFDDLGHKLGIQNMDDWYQRISAKSIIQNGGRGLLSQHGDAPLTALMAAYPEHNWIPFKFKTVPTGLWTSKENRLKFFQDLGKKLQVKTLDDWYTKLSYKVIVDNGGAGMLPYFKGSPTAALVDAYPEHNWIPWKFNSVPSSFWKDAGNKRKYFDYLGKKVGINTLDDWYEKVSVELIAEHDGIGLLAKHNRSPAACVMAAYPEHNWIPWKFKREPIGIWKSKENVSKFLAELSEKLSIQTLDDWYRVDKMQLKQFGASTLLSRYNGLYGLLKEQYPHHPWDIKKFQQKGKKAQRWLAVTLKKMFPNEGMKNYVPY